MGFHSGNGSGQECRSEKQRLVLGRKGLALERCASIPGKFSSFLKGHTSSAAT